jgi:hypothetical protein
VTLQELVQATAEGRLPALLEQRGGELTSDLASQARELFKQALRDGDGGLAEVAAMAAAQAWLQLGDRSQALVNYVDVQQIKYMRAETPEAYEEVRDGLLQSREMAGEIGVRDQAFKAATLAADCSFWAAQASAPLPREELLLQTLRDVIAASAFADPATEGEFERYVSLLAAAASDAMSTIWSDEREVEATGLLRRLAAVADETVPTEFSYRQAGDPEKTAHTAAILVSLSDTYG